MSLEVGCHGVLSSAARQDAGVLFGCARVGAFLFILVRPSLRPLQGTSRLSTSVLPAGLPGTGRDSPPVQLRKPRTSEPVSLPPRRLITKPCGSRSRVPRALPPSAPLASGLALRIWSPSPAVGAGHRAATTSRLTRARLFARVKPHVGRRARGQSRPPE